jgi:hypothetical protein
MKSYKDSVRRNNVYLLLCSAIVLVCESHVQHASYVIEAKSMTSVYFPI